MPDNILVPQVPEAAKDSPETEKAKRNRTLYKGVVGGRWYKWRLDQGEAWDFAHNDQLTDKELSALEQAGMPTFTVNKVTPAIETLRYFVTANNPRPIVAGAEATDVDMASAVNALYERAWNMSSGKSIFSQSVRDSLCRSVGFMTAYIDKNADNGLGEVLFGYVDPWNVFADPLSSDVLFRDAEFIVIKKDIKRGILMQMLPDYESKILNADCNDEHATGYTNRDVETSTSVQPTDVTQLTFSEPTPSKVKTKEDYIDYYEGYYKRKEKFWNVAMRIAPNKDVMQVIMEKINKVMEAQRAQLEFQMQDQLIAIKDEFDKGEMSENRYKFEVERIQMAMQQQLDAIQQKMLSDEVEALSVTKTYIIPDSDYKQFLKSTVTKDMIVDSTPFWKTQVDVNVSIGSDTYLYEASLDCDYIPIVPFPYIHTGTPYPVSAVQLVVGLQKEVTKAHQLMIHNASLGSSLRWAIEEGSISNMRDFERQITIPGGFIKYNKGMTPPTPILPMPLNSAFYEIVQAGGRFIEEQLGAIPLMQGNESASETTYRGLLALDEFGTRRIKAWVTDVVDTALDHLGRIWLQLAKNVYKTHKIIRIVNPDTAEVKKYEINVPMYNDYGDVVGKMLDISNTDYDLRFVSGGTLPVNRWARLQEKMEMFKMGVIDDIAFLQETDIPNKEKILQRKSIYAQLQQQLAAMEEQIKSLKGTNETLTRQLVQAGVKQKVMTDVAEMDKHVADHKANLSAIASDLQANVGQIVGALKQEAEYSKKKMKDAVEMAKIEAKASAKPKQEAKK